MQKFTVSLACNICYLSFFFDGKFANNLPCLISVYLTSTISIYSLLFLILKKFHTLCVSENLTEIIDRIKLIKKNAPKKVISTKNIQFQ